MSHPTSFFISGGTLPRDAACYVRREADQILFETLKAGQLAHILTARQMGKSSLLVRTAARLSEEGVAVVLLDLTAHGGQLSLEQWYLGLLISIGRQLRLEDELEDFWLNHPQLGPLLRWTLALEEVVLAKETRPVVIFLDELDMVLSLPFSTGEFFAGIRELHNRRTQDPRLARLTFCLAGVVSAADLIRDTRTTPFNIGTRIVLSDLPPTEALHLAQALAPDPKEGLKRLNRILYWTNGHPYLTQFLCAQLLALGPKASPRQVDTLVRAHFLSDRSRDQENHLRYVQDGILQEDGDARGRSQAVLELYEWVLHGAVVADDPTNPAVTRLRLSGVVREEAGQLVVRNRIYQRVFDQTWVLEQMQGGERLRVLAAVKRAARRRLILALLVIVALSALSLGLSNRWLEARRVGTLLEHQLYAFQVSLAQREYERSNLPRVDDLLRLSAGLAGGKLRGFEWSHLHSLRQRALLTLDAGSAVWAAAWSRDGRFLATAARDGRILEWDSVTGKTRRQYAFKDRYLTAVDFSPDGRWLASGAMSGLISLWDRSSGQLVTQNDGHQNEVRGLHFLPDGRLLSASIDGRIQVCQPFFTGCQVMQADPDLTRIRLRQDGRLLAVGHASGKVRLWQQPGLLEAGVQGQEAWLELASLRTEGGARAFAFAPAGDMVLVATAAGSLEKWQLPSGIRSYRYQSQEHGLTALDFSPDGRQLVSGAGDGVLQLWDPDTLMPRVSLRGHASLVAFAGFSPDGKRFASGAWDGQLSLWATTQPSEPFQFDPYRELEASPSDGNVFVGYDLSGQSLAARQQTLAVGSWDRSVRFFRLPDGKQKPLWKMPLPVSAVAFSPDETRLAVVMHPSPRTSQELASRIVLYDVGRQQPVLELPKQDKLVRRVAFSPDGAFLATGGNDRTTRLWQLSPLRQVATIPHLEDVYSVAFSPDGRYLACADLADEVKVYNLKRGALLVTSALAGSTVAFSPDSRYLATGGYARGHVRLYATADWQAQVLQLGHGSQVTALAFSADGSRLVTGSTNLIKLWSVPDGLEVASYTVDGFVSAVNFAERDSLLVAAVERSLWLARATLPAPVSDPTTAPR